MWSGPRNISTAMMRAWGNRADTFVIDEPFYAFYLRATGKEHPGADEVIASGETDWRKVIAQLTGPIPNGKRIFFQKQMAHHLLPEVDREWLVAVSNCFLIRDPREVIASYVKKREDPVLEDLGFMQQAEIFDFVRTRSESDSAGSRCERRAGRSWNEYCACFARQSTSTSTNRCFPGRRDCVRPTAHGPGIGTVKWQRRRRFNHIVRVRLKCPRIYRRFTSGAASVTKGFTNIDCIEAHGRDCADLRRLADDCWAFDTNAATTRESALSA